MITAGIKLSVREQQHSFIPFGIPLEPCLTDL